jgi:hypothetical protein
MKSKLFWLGMLAMMLAFGMMVVGCDNGSDNGGGLTAEQEALKQELLDDYNAMTSEEKAEWAEMVAEFGFPGNPNNWSDKDWKNYFDLMSDYYNNGNGPGGGNEPGGSGGGVNQFVGTWYSSQTGGTFSFSANGTFTMSAGYSGTYTYNGNNATLTMTVQGVTRSYPITINDGEFTYLGATYTRQ